MAVLNAEVAKLGATIPQVGLAEAIWTPGGLLRGLQFFEGNGSLSHTWNRELTLPTSGPIPLGGPVPQSDITVSQQSVSYKWFGSDLLFDRRSIAINSNIQDAKAALSIKAAKGLRRQIEQYLVTGDASSDPNQFDGLNLLFPGAVKATQHAQTRGAANDAVNGGALDWTDIYNAWDDRVFDDAKESGVWMCGSFVMSILRNMIKGAAGGANPADIMSPEFGGPFLTLMGRPVLLNNYMTKTETRGTDTTTASLWFLGIGEDGLHGRLPLGGNEMIVLEDLGRVPGYAQDVIRVMFGMALSVHSELWCARIAGIES